MRIVWIDGWQMECCGEPFELGSTVVLELRPPSDRAYMADVLGAEGAARITHEDERHGGGGDVPVPVEGVVRSIEAVSCSFAARAPGEQTRHPVPGTDLITPLRSTDDPTGESDGDGNGRMFVAYIVQFDVPADGQKAVASRSA